MLADGDHLEAPSSALAFAARRAKPARERRLVGEIILSRQKRRRGIGRW